MRLDSNPEGAAKVAGLRYVTDTVPGVARLRAGTGFRYRAADGRMVRERETLARIRKLAIPPAWENVWICARADGHLQVSFGGVTLVGDRGGELVTGREPGILSVA